MRLTIIKTNRNVIPIGGIVGILHPDTATLVIDVTIDQLESIRPKIEQLAALGLLTWTTDATPDDTANDAGEGATVSYVDAQRAKVETLSGTANTLADSDAGKIIRCTNGLTVTITIPNGLTPGTTVEYVQEGTGQVQLVGSSLTLRVPATFNPYTSEQWSTIVVTILDTDEALVRGDLAAV